MLVFEFIRHLQSGNKLKCPYLNVVCVGHDVHQMWSDMYKVVVMVMLKYEPLVAKATRSFADPK